MMDAFTHLDVAVGDPLAGFRWRMASAEIDRALVVETWKGDNYSSLEALIASQPPEFRVVPCFRPVLGRLPSGGAVTITVSYVSRIYQARMMIVSEKHTIETDGFTYVKSDLPELEFRGDKQETYEEAIHLQDLEFLRACRGNGDFVGWDETLKVLGAIDAFRALGA